MMRDHREIPIRIKIAAAKVRLRWLRLHRTHGAADLLAEEANLAALKADLRVIMRTIKREAARPRRTDDERPTTSATPRRRGSRVDQKSTTPEAKSAGLLPCPFCGDRSLSYRVDGGSCVRCDHCGASGSFAPSAEAAVAAWNKVASVVANRRPKRALADRAERRDGEEKKPEAKPHRATSKVVTRRKARSAPRGNP